MSDFSSRVWLTPARMIRVAGITLLSLTVCAVHSAQAEAERGELDSHVLTLTLENDKLLPIDSTDRHYTHGTVLTYWKPERKVPYIFTDWAPSFLDRFPYAPKDHVDRFGFALGQKIFTPEDLENTALVRGSRPYAGWLYGAFLFQRRGGGIYDLPTRDNFELTFGLVGDGTFAGDVQNWWHRVINVEEARGWRNQIRDEPAFNFSARRTALLWSQDLGAACGIDLLPSAGFSLGNVSIEARAGMEARFGWRLPNDFESPQPSIPALYGFAGIEGRAVAWNIFLDGNTYQHSHHVEKKPLVADIKYGLAWKIWKNVELSYTYIYRTREFDRQTDEDRFGSVSLKVIY